VHDWVVQLGIADPKRTVLSGGSWGGYLTLLGLGVQPPTAEWGSMVADGTQYFQWWWMGTFPGLAIFTVVLAFNFLGDSLRDVLDPRTAWRSSEEQT